MPDLDGLTVHFTVRANIPDLIGHLPDKAGHDAPRSADEAAALLQAEGEHVHVVSEGEAHCPGGRCTPAIVADLLGTASRRRPHLSAPFPLT